MKKGMRYLGCLLRDCLHFMPSYLILTLCISVVNAVLEIWKPIVIAEIFELVEDLTSEHLLQFKQDIIILCLIVSLPQAFQLVSRMLALSFDSRKEQCFGWKMFEHAKKISLEALENPGVLDAFQKADAAYTNDSMVDVLSDGFRIIKCFAISFGTIFVVARFSVWLLPCAIGTLIPYLVLTIIGEKRRTIVYRKQTAVRRRLQYLWRLFCQKESIKEMRTAGFDKYLKEKWTQANVEIVKEMEAVEVKLTKMYSLEAIIKNTFYAANIAISLFLMIKGNIAVGQFAACLTAFATLQQNLLFLGNSIEYFLEKYHHLEEYYDFFALETEQDGQKEYHPFQRQITVQDVHFRYSGSDRDTLQGVNLTINKGEHVVIVGVNGSGKTTLSKVLTGAYRACSGTVHYDDQEIKTLQKKGLYQDISLVTQDFVHYNFTLRENICISDLSHREDDDRLQQIIAAVEMQELVQTIGGADSQLGREFGGRELSGGEWQRVAIARGLFKESELIVLDEPTSALDPLVEYEILSKFLELIQGRTSIIISHRVGICRSADKVIVMSNGRVSACGTHKELLGSSREYQKIWNEQAKWY